MKLVSWYQLSFTCTILVGMLSVLLGGELPTAFWLAPLVPLAMLPLRMQGRALTPWLAPVVGALSLMMAFWVIQARGVDAALLGGAVGLMGITVGRLMTAETMAHDLQVILLTLLLFFTGSVVHTEVTYGLALIAYTIFVVWALVTRQLVMAARSEGERMGEAAGRAQLVREDVVTPGFLAATSVLAVALILSTSVLFIIFPRVGFRAFGFWRKAGTHLPGEVSLQERSSITGMSDAVIARVSGVSLEDFSRGLYLRGPVYDELTKDGFKQTARAYREPLGLVMTRPREPVFRYEVFAHPTGLPLLLTLGHVRNAEVVYGGTTNPSLQTRIKGVSPAGNLIPNRPVTGPLRYWIEGTIDRAKSLSSHNETELLRELDDNIRRFLELPVGLDGRIGELAVSLLEGKLTDRAKVEELTRFLREDFVFTLEQPSRAEADPVASFLFEEKSGHCEYFATALGLLLRTQGIPSRVVGGYYGGSWDSEGWAVFTGKHAHVWVEWFDVDKGWVIAEGTPVGYGGKEFLTGFAVFYERMRRMWDERVVEFGLTEQFHLIMETAGAVGPLAKSFRGLVKGTMGWIVVGVLMMAAAGGVLWFRRQRRRRESLVPVCAALQRLVQRKRDNPIELSETIREAVNLLVKEHKLEELQQRRVMRALDCYERERFGYRTMGRAESTELVKLVDSI